MIDRSPEDFSPLFISKMEAIAKLFGLNPGVLYPKLTHQPA
jgi:hypothetical protein